MPDTLFSYTPERLQDLSRGYSLTCGGYSFTSAEGVIPELIALRAVLLEAPDTDYLPWANDSEGTADWYAFIPGIVDHEAAWPAEVLVGEGEDETCLLTGSGFLEETDRECGCNGQPAPTTPRKWEITGNTLDPVWPDCPHCEGEGTILSEGGRWATYRWVHTDDRTRKDLK
jgi:hypothetical protein